MSSIVKKILIISSSFTLLSLLLYFFNLNLNTSFYNNKNIINDTVRIKINFDLNPKLENKKVKLYYNTFKKDSVKFQEDKSVSSFIEDQTLYFEVYSQEIPNIYRIDFDKNIKTKVTINDISIQTTNESLKLNLKRFLAHPSINIVKKKSDYIYFDLNPNKNISYNPYIYLKNPISIHKLTSIEYFLIFLIIVITSFLICKLFFIKYQFSVEFINSILIFLLFISLLFREHWASKVLIMIGSFTVFLLIKGKIKLKSVNFYGILLFFLYASSSVLWSIDINNTIVKIKSFLPLLIIPVWLSSLNNKIEYYKIFKNLSTFYLLIALITILFATFRYYTTLSELEFYYHKLVSPLSANAIYISLLFLFIFLFNFYFLLKNKRKNFFEILSLTFLLIYILLLSSKMITFLTFLSIIIISISFYDYNIYSKKAVIPLIIILISISILSFRFSNNLSKRVNEISNIEKIKEAVELDHFENNYKWNGLSLRLLQLRSFYDIIQNDDFNFFLGVGLKNGQILLNERYHHYNLYTGEKWEENGGYLKYNFHNQYAQTFVELGFLGFILLVYIFIRLLKSSNKNSYLLYSVLLIFSFLMFTESIFMRQKGVIAFTLVTVISLRINTQK